MTRKPSYPQRVALSVLARGGFIDNGTPGQSSPRLYEADARLFAFLPRQTLEVLRRRFWVGLTDGPLPGRQRYTVTTGGLGTARAFKP